MTNNITKATSIIVRAFNKRGVSATRKEVNISEIVIATKRDKSEYVKVIKGSMFGALYGTDFKFTYYPIDNKLLIQDVLFGGVQ